MTRVEALEALLKLKPQAFVSETQANGGKVSVLFNSANDVSDFHIALVKLFNASK